MIDNELMATINYDEIVKAEAGRAAILRAAAEMRLTLWDLEATTEGGQLTRQLRYEGLLKHDTRLGYVVLTPDGRREHRRLKEGLLTQTAARGLAKALQETGVPDGTAYVAHPVPRSSWGGAEHGWSVSLVPAP